MKTSTLWTSLLMGALVAPAGSAEPAWWRQTDTRILAGPPVAPDNYAPANVGQLKHVASMARLHLEALLPGGAGPTINALVNSFKLPPGSTPEQVTAWQQGNLAPVNLGQLKAVAKPFYDRLAAYHYDTRANLIAHGYPASWPSGNPYPWDPATPVADNYAPANMGQLKVVFSFDLSGPPGGLPAWWLQHFFPGQTEVDPNADADGDHLPNGLEFLYRSDPTNAADTGVDTDGDGLPDGWEMYLAGNLTSLGGTTNTDNDWLDASDEFRLGLSPLVNDDTDLDGWLDRDEARVVANSAGAVDSVGAIVPWGDNDGDGQANAKELIAGTDPFVANTAPFVPLVKLVPADFANTGTTSSWTNSGSLGGNFTSGTDRPLAVTVGSHTAIQFQVGKADWMVGSWTAPWLNGSGSRTVAAWVYNPDVSTAQQDVVFSWGAGSLGSPTPTLFSCRYGTQGSGSALSFSGTGATDRAWGTVAPLQGQWSFVVYRYDQHTGSLLVMRNFQAAVSDYGAYLQTGIFDTTGKPHRMVVGGDNLGDGTRNGTLVTALSIGELRVYGEALPLSEIKSFYETTRASYGIATTLTDVDGDGVPDALETSLGWSVATNDSDLDGIVDSLEFDRGTSGKDYYNGGSQVVQVVSGGGQQIDAGTETPVAIVYQVTDLNGTPLTSAPFKVDVTTLPTAGGQIRLTPAGSPLGGTLSTQTDANGQVKVIFKAN